MSFISPTSLVWLLAIPFAITILVLLERYRDERRAAWGSPALLPNMVAAAPGWRRQLPVALLLAGASLLLVGVARPQATVTVKRQQATLILVLDVSGSMAAKDSAPTRLGAAKRAALVYLKALPKSYRAAVVTFSDHSAVVSAPTQDRSSTSRAIVSAKTGPQGTALAEAVTRAVTVARSVKGEGSGPRPPAVIVLLSDGGQTAGRLTPQQAAGTARNARIPVFAVSVGTPDGVVTQQLQGGFTERFQVPVQPQSLELIARETRGRFTGGARFVDPRAAVDDLGSRVGHKRKKIEVTAVAAGGGIAFMLAGGLLSGLWFRRLA